MDNRHQVLKKHKITKTAYNKILENIDKIIDDLRTRAKKAGIDAQIVLGGSAAKGTLLKNDFDCDIFIRFDPVHKEISDILEKLLQGYEYTRIHGSRDYFQFQKHDILFEIVPVLLIKYARDAENVTDMSPLHVTWIKKQLARNPVLADEIILAKTFCKAQNVYGAESYINGFSGHVLDILITYYGSFIKLLENSLSWQKYKMIDVEGHGNSSELNDSKISPLIVIDPVDFRRNAAAALSEKRFSEFKTAAGEYLDKPGLDFFEKKIITNETLEENAGKNQLIILKARPLDNKTDVSGTKLLKIYEHLARHLEINEFMIIDSGWDWDKTNSARMWFIIDPESLSKQKEHMGPPLSEEKAAAAFTSKHPEYFEKDKRLFCMIDRDFTNADKLIMSLIKDEYVTSRCRGIK